MSVNSLRVEVRDSPPSRWWQPGFPPELRAVVEPLILQHAHLLPTWIHELCVKYEAENGNCALMGTEHEYRRAHLTLTGNFLKADADERWQTIRHEFLHVPLHPLTSWTKDLIHRLAGDDDRLRDWLLSEWQERLEAAVCDLEHALRRES